MTAIFCKIYRIFIYSSMPWLVAGGLFSSANAASISGELYYQTVGTPLPATSLENIWVKAYLENPTDPGSCNSTQDNRWYTAETDNYWCSWCDPEREVTEYYLWGLPVGTYYLRTAEEWWDGEQACNNASSITIADEWDYIDGKNLIVYPGAVISGTLYDESDNGPPQTGLEVLVHKIENNDPCTPELGWPLLHAVTSQFDSFYNINGVPIGDYVLKTDDVSGSYVSEFYTSSGGTTGCEGAEILSITDSGDMLTGKDFFLDSLQATPVMSPIYLLLLNNQPPVTGY
ncbi:MAG: hypothetical protein WGN25_06355 [Candidatus Electrothrix sp. GW3-4]|uniref:hypothetical protein n=1 Tax=Candidatus Electrothrix sp. GW3-4 TaxID=3126740 RepID=UPI0030D096B3